MFDFLAFRSKCRNGWSLFSLFFHWLLHVHFFCWGCSVSISARCRKATCQGPNSPGNVNFAHCHSILESVFDSLIDWKKTFLMSHVGRITNVTNWRSCCSCSWQWPWSSGWNLRCAVSVGGRLKVEQLNNLAKYRFRFFFVHFPAYLWNAIRGSIIERYIEYLMFEFLAFRSECRKCWSLFFTNMFNFYLLRLQRQRHRQNSKLRLVLNQ